MDRRDQELLDKQLGRITPAQRRDGVLMLAIASVFFAGIALGSFLFTPQNEPVRMATNQAAAAMTGTPITR